MNLAAKVTTGVAALVVVGLGALAAPAIGATWTAAAPFVETAADAFAAPVPTPEPTVEPVVEVEEPPPGIAPEGPLDRDGRVRIELGWGTSVSVLPGACIPALIEHGKLLGTVIDHGESLHAQGVAIYNEAGKIKGYEVAEGDTLTSIGERFCMAGSHIYGANRMNQRAGGENELLPGEVLVLDPWA